MRITNGIEMLELSNEIMGRKNVIHPTLIWDKDTTILVDAGYPNQLSQLRDTIERTGLPFLKLNKLIITHHDMDHIGGADVLASALPESLEIIAHTKERKYIQSEICPTKITQLKSQVKVMSPEMKIMYENLKTGYKNHKIIVNKVVKSGEELPYCGGIKIIYSPGHTPGHISLYIEQSKVLIAGDALFAENGVLTSPPKFFNYNNDLALKSINKFDQYDIRTIICYHGGVYFKNTNISIAELVKV
jgi:glyoxylase-like metal-dependent hydrolase (beta-lactamase superfamily II)